SSGRLVTFDFTCSTNTFAGLNEGIKCSGISIALFCLIWRPIFLARFLMTNEPKPRMYTFSPSASESFTSLKNISNATNTSTFGTPVLSEILETKSAFLIITRCILDNYDQIGPFKGNGKFRNFLVLRKLFTSFILTKAQIFQNQADIIKLCALRDLA